ncbi:hypothetical protein [cf. Phormidesmis sp. LEGE 11477]|uniref:hypothetical protein n=1 Tax=cf. Phormidesmis sp. LEGE 11477 TaxID=1828680 RepID=UPI0018817B21|nr:hypothetical protein [cf. Phormidesmis sp. LEGE 11477]MBE9064787.1 hypothetical protein [cf. Phormidesmis sp. LEGE 11477]
MTNSASVPENTIEKTGDKASDRVSKSLLEVTLDGAIALAKESGNSSPATTQFEALLAQVEADHSAVAPLLKTLWQEYLSAQRSATFWQNMSDAEKDLSEKMSESNIQLKQNYMRLIQEQ